MATALPRRFALSSLRPARALLSSPRPSRTISSVSKLLPQIQQNAAAAADRWASIQQARTFTSSRKQFASEEAPSAHAYLASGVIAGGRDLVDVNKVLVIGSGGLSIGQAGEFDYSGWANPYILSHDAVKSLFVETDVGIGGEN
jgi:carbamoyl-phosphate synthase large subunit